MEERNMKKQRKHITEKIKEERKIRPRIKKLERFGLTNKQRRQKRLKEEKLIKKTE